MDEDKMLNKIRALTYNDEPTFPQLMDMVIALALNLKHEYLENARRRRQNQ